MILDFRNDTRGAAAIEFAMIVPVMVAIVLGAFVFALAFWIKSGLQEASEQTARCAAIGSVLCASVTTGCDSSIAAICYAETIAKQRGIGNVKASEVTINTANSVGGVMFTTITISHPFSLAGYSTVLTATSSFPNKI